MVPDPFFLLCERLDRGNVAADEWGHTGPMNIGNPDEFTIRQLAGWFALGSTQLPLIEKPLPQDDPMQRKPVVISLVSS